MNNDTKKDDTELIIKKTAKKLFFSDGKFDATTQEIADTAGVNRTLINYYFRSRDNLFNIVFEEAMNEERAKSALLKDASISFKKKLEHYIEAALNKTLEYPFLEAYIVSQINKGKIYDETKKEQMTESLVKFDKELKQAIKDGQVKPVKTIQFIINLVSLISFPSCMRPLLQKTLEVSDVEYEDIIKQRKEVILNTLFIN